MSLLGKTALVTGAAGGLGLAIARALHAAGANVMVCDINPERAEATLRIAAENGTPIESVHPVDLTKPDDVRRYVDMAASRFGKADVLVNAGAIEPRMAPVGEMDFDYTMLPKEKPPAWPDIVPNRRRLGRFVYEGMVDVMRGISPHVSIGRVKKKGNFYDTWFVLVRYEAPPAS